MPAIDISHRIIQPSPPSGRQKVSKVRWHFWRRSLQIVSGILFVALPFTDGLRLDIRRGIFYFAWHRMALQDLAVLFWVAMLGVWALFTLSFLYGRFWCGWVCPQTQASDFADSVKRRLDQTFHTRPGKPLFLVSRALWTAVILAISFGAGVTVAMYWLAPADVWRGAIAPLRDPAAAAVTYGIAALLAADMLFIRRRFCSDACPYGLLLAVVADKDTLAVRYLDERDDECIRCGKCVVDCPMGIDIKKGVSQHDCIGCGECIDSCNDVLGKRGIPGLIEYRFGTEPNRTMPSLSPLQRLGLWNAIRWGVLGTLAAFGVIVVVMMVGRWPLTATINANGAISRSGGAVTNSYEVTVNNNTPVSALYTLSVAGVRGATLVGSAVRIDPRGNKTVAITVRDPIVDAPDPGKRAPIAVTIASGRDRCILHTIFYTPQPGE